MTPEQFAGLRVGQTVRHRCAAEAMTVESNDAESGVLLSRRIRAHNPQEWLLIGDDGQPVDDAVDPATLRLPPAP